MQKQTSLYIPEPCHEDWNKMTPTQQGKFCASCNKQVVDFSLMSDNQILNFLSNQSGKLCGRFDAQQVQRPLAETKIKKKKSWWMALTMPLLFLFHKSEAQNNNKLTGDTIYNVLPSYETTSEQLVGKVAICEPSKQITITGKIIDEENNPIAYATIMQKGTKHGTESDSLGNFSININSDEDSVTLVVSYVGYETNEITINENEPHIIINMRLKPIIAGDIIVVGYTSTRIRSTLGGLIACVRITRAEQIDTSIRKAFGISRIFPNPATKGSVIHLQIKQAGEYQLQLLDNQSRLIKTEEINADAEKSTTQVQLPSNIAAGIYYLRLINEQAKKSYTEKLIVQ